MDVSATLDAPVAAADLFAWVEDLGRYPEWLEIVPRAIAVDPIDGDPGPAWSVDLRGRLGPLARSKRLRMARTVHESPRRVVFERYEHDGRQHSPWVLTAEIEEVASNGDAASCRLHMHLHYGGRLAGRPVEMLLGQEIERSRVRLLALLSGAGAG